MNGPDRRDEVAPRREAPRLLTDDDVDAAAAILARAFDADPVAQKLLPRPEHRDRWARWRGAWLVRSALPFGSAYGVEGTPGLIGVALWYPPGVSPPLLASNVLAAVREFRPAVSPAVRMVPRAALTTMRAPNALVRFVRQRSRAVETASVRPTWHLAYLAVDPAHQGRGAARRLLDHVLDRCDDDGAAAWLETTDPANVPLYERFGFATVESIPASRRLPPLWVMRRVPQISDDG
jgi:ribosomal protein S18 acetylase RimI-like enzyme